MWKNLASEAKCRRNPFYRDSHLSIPLVQKRPRMDVRTTLSWWIPIRTFTGMHAESKKKVGAEIIVHRPNCIAQEGEG